MERETEPIVTIRPYFASFLCFKRRLCKPFSAIADYLSQLLGFIGIAGASGFITAGWAAL